MVVVAIIAIISVIAYPAYRSYVEDTYFGRMQVDVKVCALTMDRLYTNSFSYDGLDKHCTLWSPADGPQANAKYNLTVPTATASAYTIRAEPVSGPCNDRCYGLDSKGIETVE